MRHPLLAALIFPVLLSACKTPAPPPEPEGPLIVALSLERIEALDPDKVSLHYTLKVENTRPRPLTIRLREWRLLLNGRENSVGAILGIPDDFASLGPASSTAIPLRLDLDLSSQTGTIPGEGLSEDYIAGLTLYLDSAGEGFPPLEVSAEAVFPRIQKPVFSIIAISITKAELINTRLQVRLRIDNPNSFPLDLSGLDYELYGGDRFWAEGTEKSRLLILPGSSAETRLSLVMNFINMKRELLDQITARRQVAYRFSGSVNIDTGLEYLPHFRMTFDRSGLSEVTE